jgi:hypothetical protein
MNVTHNLGAVSHPHILNLVFYSVDRVSSGSSFTVYVPEFVKH